MAGETANVASALELSDEEFLKQGTSLLNAADKADADSNTPEAIAAAEEAARVAAEAQAEADRVAAEEAATAAAEAQAAIDAAAAAGGAKDDKTGEGDGTNKEANTDPELDADGNPIAKKDLPAKAAGEAGEKKEVADDKAGKKDEPAAINYQAEYERILAPFKANGREIKVENVDEALRLMQMGANYNKKMAGLKPNLALMKMLENNGLLSAEKISFLIDLDKKNPEAIGKLIKDSGINPLDISTEKAGEYRPGNHNVADVEVELDNVLDEIKDSSKYDQTLHVVAKQWDGQSRLQISQQPQLIKVINGHMENGIYELVAAEMERGRLFGKLGNVSDLEAYRQVGDAMAAAGKFDHILKKPGQADADGSQTPIVKTVVDPKPKKADEDKREEQRRAAAPAKGTAPTNKAKPDFNPLALSDEDFAKFKPTF